MYFCLVRARVARSRWPGPVARSRWPGPGSPLSGPAFLPWPGGPVPVPVPAQVLPSVLPMVWWPGGPVARSRSRLLSRCRSAGGPGPGPGPVPVPVPVLAPARSRWPGPSPNKADLCSVASFKQSLPGIWWFYAVRAKPLVRGKQYCEVGTIIEQKQEPNGCQSQLLDMKTLDVASLAAIFLECLRSRCCLPGVCFLEPF